MLPDFYQIRQQAAVKLAYNGGFFSRCWTDEIGVVVLGLDLFQWRRGQLIVEGPRLLVVGHAERI